MPLDKKLHIVVGFIIGFLGAYFLRSALFGFLAAVAAGALKEIYDKCSGKGTPEWLDFLATAASGLIGAGIYLILGA
jgi:uncharacterized protein YfiM (DUF2279 family)